MESKITNKVAVVTLNWNGCKDTIECIDSLQAAVNPLDIVIVDNGSTDGSSRVLETRFKDKIHIMRNNKNLGYSVGMNTGLEYAFKMLGSDYCIVINNDTTVDPAFAYELVKSAERHPEAGFITGKVYFHSDKRVFQSVGKLSHPVKISGGNIGKGETDTGQYDLERQIDFCDDIFWLVTRKVWEQTGGYDPEFFLQAEDFEWQIRAKKAGFCIYFTPEAKIWHKESMKLGKASPQKLYYDTRNPAIAVFKNYNFKECNAYLKHYLIQSVALPLIRNLARTHFKHAWAVLTGFISFLIWLTFRRRIANANN